VYKNTMYFNENVLRVKNEWTILSENGGMNEKAYRTINNLGSDSSC